MKSKVGRPRRRWVGCEMLENRAYAARVRASNSDEINDFTQRLLGLPTGELPYGATTDAVVRHGPASVVLSLEASQATPQQFISVYLGQDKTLYIRGTFGDDTINARVVHGVLRINVASFQNRTYLTSAVQALPNADSYRPVADSPELSVQWGLSSNTYEVDAADVRRIVVDGQAGVDEVRVKGVSSVPVVYDVEQATIQQTAAPAGQTPSDTLRTDGYGPKSGWAALARRERKVAKASRATIAFFGDSHVKKFPEMGISAWQNYFPHATALGISGDSTRQLLTRIEDGVFDDYKPDTLVVSVGANNLNNPATGGTDRQVADGILAVIDALHVKLPNTRIALIGLLPRTGVGLNERVRAVNAAVAASADEHRFTFVNVYDRFVVDPDRLMTPSSHYTAKGYSALATLLLAALQRD